MHDSLTMDFHSKFGRAEFYCNLLVKQAGNDQGHDLAFAGRERFVPDTMFDKLSPLFPVGAIPPDCLLNRVEQGLVTEGLLNRTALHRLY